MVTSMVQEDFSENQTMTLKYYVQATPRVDEIIILGRNDREPLVFRREGHTARSQFDLYSPIS